VALGSFTPTADMKSGAMLFATPESLRATQIAGQMARHYGLPLRASNACSAPVPDGQAMWESAAMLWTAVRSGASIIYHAAGWIEGGMSASCEKFLMDCEVLQQIQRYCAPGLNDCGDEGLSLDLIARIGHGGHYFGHAQTDAQSRDAFLRGFLSDTRSYENWAQDGAVWTSERAHRMVPRMLADCVDPPLPEGAQDQLDRFLDGRRQAAGVAEPA
jgi:trimethylamine--corrinoid protein Co-methyltransferase